MRVRFLLTLTALVLTAGVLSPLQVESRRAPKKTILVVTVTKGFRHDSIPVAEQTLEMLGKQTNAWNTDFVRTDEEMKAKMTAAALKKYDAIVFANTTGTLPLPDPQGFLDYIKSGKGFVGMHAASDTFHQWPGGASGEVSAYIKMLGGEFRTHHRQCAISAIIADPHHPATKPLIEAGKKFNPATAGKPDLPRYSSPEGDRWKAFDEIYLFQNVDRPNLRLLCWLNEHPDDGAPESRQPGEHMVSWCRAYGKGRVFYTSLGHRQEMWRDRYYQEHITGGIRFALGLAKGSTTPTPIKAVGSRQ